MDPFARKMIRSSLIYGAVLVLMFAVLTVVYFHLRPLCSDETLSQINSPDKQWTAAILQRRCGEEAPFSTHVNLRPVQEAIRRGFFTGEASDGEIFRIEQDARSAGITVQWTAPGRVVIGCSHCQIAFLQQKSEHWRGITISYFLEQ
ncbi:MAG: hypothetical protein DMG65_07505 [Candidatus Angelobacter sp. Gp1-AA117]|nr:MAG: hypothetical protein DMG65_07505 [Candidatus Angelobacter sp. Gp1-AA117]